MRIGANSVVKRTTLSNKKLSKRVTGNSFKDLNPSYSDNFSLLNSYFVPLRSSTWSTSSNQLTTPTSASNYPILSNFDSRATDVVSTISLASAGPGFAFWLIDENNWWAATTFYTSESEGYSTDNNSCQPCVTTPPWSYYCPNPGAFQCGCRSGPAPSACCCSQGCCSPQGGGTSCSPCPGTRQRYKFYVKLFKAENGTISEVTNILLRSLCSITSNNSPCTVGSTDNINGIQVSTSGNTITVRARDDANNFYGTSISYNAVSPNKGYKSGIIFTPGSNYLLSSVVTSINLVEQ